MKVNAKFEVPLMVLSYLKETTDQRDQHSASTCANVQATEKERERETDKQRKSLPIFPTSEPKD
jgi:hypothetical protein